MNIYFEMSLSIAKLVIWVYYEKTQILLQEKSIDKKSLYLEVFLILLSIIFVESHNGF